MTATLPCRNRTLWLAGRWCLAIVGAFGGWSWAADSPVSFQLDVQPVLTAYGCNSGPCHGKARGQRGFKLSLFGYDSDFDYAAITQMARGRRLFLAAPERSLLLRKATGAIPHGGGVRFDNRSPAYRILLDWIRQGAPRRVPHEPKLVGITLMPQAVVLEPGADATLNVTARYSDGSTRDVTTWTTFQSNESATVAVDGPGHVKAGTLAGEATIMARYMNHIETCDVAIPLPGDIDRAVYKTLPVRNFIDRHVWAKLEKMRLLPAPPATDATFLRRVSIDLIGRLPTAEEARRFLDDPSPDKRARLVDRLLNRPEFADHWANKWVDLLRPNPYRVGIKAVFNFDHWIRDQFRRDVPYDQLVRELLTAEGSTWHNGAVTLFRDRRTPEERTAIVSQLFLGIRLECAKCHHHPFEKWSQGDYFGFAAFFSHTAAKGTGLSPPISGGEEFFYESHRRVTTVRHPVTGESLEAKPLFGTIPPAARKLPPRRQLAAWITSRDNPFFAQVFVNRVWADLMGRGLVEPVDDFRASNPPSNPQLLRALAEDFAAGGYRLKPLLRTITSSYVYGLSSQVHDRNAVDRRNYSRHYRRRLRAEVLLQAVVDVTGVTESFTAMPPGSRPNQIWSHRVGSVFLDTFGRPDPNQDPPCERVEDVTVTQTLHLMNSDRLQAKIGDPKGRAAALAASKRSPADMIEELYLTIYSRYPTDDERRLFVERFGKSRDANERQRIVEDWMWAMLNSAEFLFQD